MGYNLVANGYLETPNVAPFWVCNGFVMGFWFRIRTYGPIGSYIGLVECCSKTAELHSELYLSGKVCLLQRVLEPVVWADCWAHLARLFMLR